MYGLVSSICYVCVCGSHKCAHRGDCLLLVTGMQSHAVSNVSNTYAMRVHKAMRNYVWGGRMFAHALLFMRCAPIHVVACMPACRAHRARFS